MSQQFYPRYGTPRDGKTASERSAERARRVRPPVRTLTPDQAAHAVGCGHHPLSNSASGSPKKR